MMNYRIFIILLLIFCPCFNSNYYCPSDTFDDLKCYASHNRTIENNKCTFDKSDIISYSVNSLSGELEVIFLLKLECNFKEYELKLFVYETDSNVCRSDFDYKIHSIINYERQNIYGSSIKKCDNQAKIIFSYVYSGCYALRLEPKYSSSNTSSPVTKKGISIKTNYKKTLISEPNVTFDYRDELDSRNHTIFLQMKHDLFMCKNPSLELIFSCKDTSEKAIVECFIPETSCNISQKSTDIVCKLTKNYIIQCDIKGITRGNYTFEIEILSLDIRCNSDSEAVWGIGPCKWFIEKSIQSSDSITTDLVLEHKEYDLVYLYIVLFIVIIVLISGFIYCKTRRSGRRLLSIENEDDEIELIGNPKVLLLYARENELFFETMSGLKNIIQKHSDQVYDIYDPLNFDQIAVDPDAWIREKLQDKSYKIVLILNETGYLLSNSTTSSQSIYKQRQCYDNLFPYALKTLSQNLKNNESYTKLFVVRLNFDRYDYKFFEFLNPFTRYKLPDHFDQLLSNMFDKQVSSTEIVKSFEYKQFELVYQKLEVFRKETPDYLKDILNVQVVNNVSNGVIPNGS